MSNRVFITNINEAYNKGLQDAWELVVKLANMDYEDRQQILGVNNAQMKDILKFHTPQEALAKLEAYEKEQNEIKVGDVVEIKSTKECYVILAIYGKTIWGYSCEGVKSPLQELDGVTITKTGKHIDIQSVLKQIGSDADELS